MVGQIKHESKDIANASQAVSSGGTKIARTNSRVNSGTFDNDEENGHKTGVKRERPKGAVTRDNAERNESLKKNEFDAELVIRWFLTCCEDVGAVNGGQHSQSTMSIWRTSRIRHSTP